MGTDECIEGYRRVHRRVLMSASNGTDVPFALDKVEFVWLDETAGTEACGEYTKTTRDGRVRITEGDRHVAIVTQDRWGHLKGANAHLLCCQPGYLR